MHRRRDTKGTSKRWSIEEGIRWPGIYNHSFWKSICSPSSSGSSNEVLSQYEIKKIHAQHGHVILELVPMNQQDTLQHSVILVLDASIDDETTNHQIEKEQHLVTFLQHYIHAFTSFHAQDEVWIPTLGDDSRFSFLCSFHRNEIIDVFLIDAYCFILQNNGRMYLWHFSLENKKWTWLSQFCILGNEHLQWTKPVVQGLVVKQQDLEDQDKASLLVVTCYWWERSTTDSLSLTSRVIHIQHSESPEKEEHEQHKDGVQLQTAYRHSSRFLIGLEDVSIHSCVWFYHVKHLRLWMILNDQHLIVSSFDDSSSSCGSWMYLYLTDSRQSSWTMHHLSGELISMDAHTGHLRGYQYRATDDQILVQELGKLVSSSGSSMNIQDLYMYHSSVFLLTSSEDDSNSNHQTMFIYDLPQQQQPQGDETHNNELLPCFEETLIHETPCRLWCIHGIGTIGISRPHNILSIFRRVSQTQKKMKTKKTRPETWASPDEMQQVWSAHPNKNPVVFLAWCSLSFENGLQHCPDQVWLHMKEIVQSFQDLEQHHSLEAKPWITPLNQQLLPYYQKYIELIEQRDLTPETNPLKPRRMNNTKIKMSASEWLEELAQILDNGEQSQMLYRALDTREMTQHFIALYDDPDHHHECCPMYYECTVRLYFDYEPLEILNLAEALETIKKQKNETEARGSNYYERALVCVPHSSTSSFSPVQWHVLAQLYIRINDPVSAIIHILLEGQQYALALDLVMECLPTQELDLSCHLELLAYCIETQSREDIQVLLSRIMTSGTLITTLGQVVHVCQVIQESLLRRKDHVFDVAVQVSDWSRLLMATLTRLGVDRCGLV